MLPGIFCEKRYIYGNKADATIIKIQYSFLKNYNIYYQNYPLIYSFTKIYDRTSIIGPPINQLSASTKLVSCPSSFEEIQHIP